MINFEYTSSNRQQHTKQAMPQQSQMQHRSDTDHRHDSYDAASSANLSHVGRGSGVGLESSYGGGSRHAAATANANSNNRFFCDDRSLSGQHRGNSGNRQQPQHSREAQMNNYVMPPRYPARGPQPSYSNQNTGNSNLIFSPQNGAQFPRGGTGDTGNDSFASSFKQQPHFYGGGPANYSAIANANSFHQNLAGDTSTGAQSVDYAMTHTSNTDWHHRAHGFENQRYENGSNSDNTTVLTETRQNKWAFEFGKLDEKYMRDDSDQTLFSNQKVQPQMDRLEDDDQRSPDRRPQKQIQVDPSNSPDRHRDDLFVQQHMSPERRETFGQVRPGSSGFQINMIGQTSASSNSYGHSSTINASRAYQKQQELNSQQQHMQSKLSEILQKSRRSANAGEANSQMTQSTNFHPSRSQAMMQDQQHHRHHHRELQPSKQTSAPQQKSRKQRKTILDQREHFKIRPARCYLGSEYQPEIHYSKHTLTWQEAIACIEDLGVDMSAHLEKFEQRQHAYNDLSHGGLGGNFSKTIGYDFNESNSKNDERRQVARSDGFKNWNSKRSGNNNLEDEQHSRLQTDFYQLSRAVTKDDNSTSDDLASFAGQQKQQSLTQNNFFKSDQTNNNGDRRYEDENVSNDDDSYQRRQELFQKNKIHIEQKSSLQQSKSPSGGVVQTKAFQPQERKQHQVISEQAQAEAIQTLKNLRYSDLIYLLNILKLQRSKNAESLARNHIGQAVTWEEAREQWINDLQLALSVAVSAEERDSKDTSMIARVLVQKVEACRLDKFTAGVLSSAVEDKYDDCDLKYEHFIGPLVILCAVNNLLRAQGNNTGEAECISTIKLCFDQFERYYAKAISTAGGQRRSNSMSGPIAFPQPRTDSFEVSSEPFKNFIVSLKTFIERENLPCKANLRQALENVALSKVQSNFLIFPQNSQQLILSQLNRLFGSTNQNLHERQQFFDQIPAHHQNKMESQLKTTSHLIGPTTTSAITENLLLTSNNLVSHPGLLQSQYSPKSTSNISSGLPGNKKCAKHGFTLCPCGGSEDQVPSQTASELTPTRASNNKVKPSFTLQPQFSQQQAHQPAERRQHSMVDFSASRRLKTQESGGNYVSNTVDIAAEYRPFSTIISGKSDNVEAESVRPSIYGSRKPNEPMSLELENKRSVPSQQSFSSKSVQKPKKGILKQSSSYLDSHSKPPSSTHYAKKLHNGGKHSSFNRASNQSSLTHPNSSHPSPYTAMKKIGKIAGKGGVSNPSPRGSSTSKKQSTQQRYDSQKNILHRLGGGTSDEPPKFTHAANNNKTTSLSANNTNGSIFSPKTAATRTAGNSDYGDQGSAKKRSFSKRQQQVGRPSTSNTGQQINSLSQILRAAPITNNQSSTPQNASNGSRQATMQRMSTQQYSSISGYSASQPGSNAEISTQQMAQATSTASGLVANSMKYLRTMTNTTAGSNHGSTTLNHSNHHHQTTGVGSYHHKAGSMLNTSAHSSNVLVQAQNMQNRNDSFGMHSSYSANHHVTSGNNQAHNSNVNSHLNNGEHHPSYKIQTLYKNQQRTGGPEQASNRVHSVKSPQNMPQHQPQNNLMSSIRKNSSRDSFTARQQQQASPQRTSIHQSPQQRTTTLTQYAQLLNSSAARRSNSHQGPAGGSTSSHPISLLQTSSLHTSGGGTTYNMMHPQNQQQHGHLLNSSSSNPNNHNQNNSGDREAAYLPHPRLVNSARKQQSGSSQGPMAFAGVTHTDFNQVSQFSLSSQGVAGLGGANDYGSQSANNPSRRRPIQQQQQQQLY